MTFRTKIDGDLQLLTPGAAMIITSESRRYGKYFWISRGNGISGNRRQNLPRVREFESVDKRGQLGAKQILMVFLHPAKIFICDDG